MSIISNSNMRIFLFIRTANEMPLDPNEKGIPRVPTVQVRESSASANLLVFHHSERIRRGGLFRQSVFTKNWVIGKRREGPLRLEAQLWVRQPQNLVTFLHMLSSLKPRRVQVEMRGWYLLEQLRQLIRSKLERDLVRLGPENS